MPEQDQSVEGPIDRTQSVSWEDVKKTATATSTEAKPAEEVKTEQPSQDVPVETKPEATIDYEAELAKYKAKAEREESVRKFERAERKRLEKELETRSTEENVEVEPQADLDTLVERKLETIRRQEREDVIDDILSDLSDNQHERDLIKAVYENRLRPTGWSKKAIREDLEEARIIANRSRLETLALQKAKEKVRSDIAKEKAMTDSASTGSSIGRQPPESQPSFNQNEMKWLSRVGKTKIDT